jgi:hypothetical protein
MHVGGASDGTILALNGQPDTPDRDVGRPERQPAIVALPRPSSGLARGGQVGIRGDAIPSAGSRQMCSRGNSHQTE